MHVNLGQIENASQHIIKLPSWGPGVCPLISGVLTACHFDATLAAASTCNSTAYKHCLPTPCPYAARVCTHDLKAQWAPTRSTQQCYCQHTAKGCQKAKKSGDVLHFKADKGLIGSLPQIRNCEKWLQRMHSCLAQGHVAKPNLSHTTTNSKHVRTPPPKGHRLQERNGLTLHHTSLLWADRGASPCSTGKLWQYLVLMAHQTTSHMPVLQQAPLCLLHTLHHKDPHSRFSKASQKQIELVRHCLGLQ